MIYACIKETKEYSSSFDLTSDETSLPSPPLGKIFLPVSLCFYHMFKMADVEEGQQTSTVKKVSAKGNRRRFVGSKSAAAKNATSLSGTFY